MVTCGAAAIGSEYSLCFSRAALFLHPLCFRVAPGIGLATGASDQESSAVAVPFRKTSGPFLPFNVPRSVNDFSVQSPNEGDPQSIQI